MMAPGCEPASVKAMMEALRPLVLGQTLAGAGGGGFLYLLTREPQQREEVLRVLSSIPVRRCQSSYWVLTRSRNGTFGPGTSSMNQERLGCFSAAERNVK